MTRTADDAHSKVHACGFIISFFVCYLNAARRNNTQSLRSRHKIPRKKEKKDWTRQTPDTMKFNVLR